MRKGCHRGGKGSVQLCNELETVMKETSRGHYLLIVTFFTLFSGRKNSI